jgi:hypothetical protein
MCSSLKLSLPNLTKRIGKKHFKGLAYHLPEVGVGFIFQLLMEFERENFRTAPAWA